MAKKKDKSKERAKLIEEAIKIVADSLTSHTGFTHKEHKDGKAFHKRCCAEYARVIDILTKLY